MAIYLDNAFLGCYFGCIQGAVEVYIKGNGPVVEPIRERAVPIPEVQNPFSSVSFQAGREINDLRTDRILIAGGWSQERRGGSGDGTNQTDPVEKAAVERNTAAVNQMFPGAENDNLRQAAYYYLMHEECQDGYPVVYEEDMKLLKQKNVLKQLDELVQEHTQQGLVIGSCGLVS